MPANLPPQYHEAEENLRLAKTIPEKVAALEEMLAVMPKHKGTDHLRAKLRAKIAQLTEASEKRLATRRTSTVIPREGAAQVAVIGLPNAGKSQLVSRVTNASPAVADYPFTTHRATPGMMEFENIKIQLIDTPPLAPQAIDFWLPPLLRRADALLVMLDLSSAPQEQLETIIRQLENMRIIIGGGEAQEDSESMTRQKKALIIGNKLDLANAQQNYAALAKKYGERFPLVAISARDGTGLEEFKLKLYQLLDIIRVYTKAPGKKPVFTDPVVLPRGSTLEDAAAGVHKDFRDKLKYARLWGSGKHDGIMVKRDHIMQDGDIIELHLQKE
jgi:ribosome-interacting GTPase 1